ncbi:hypothetical protein ABH61_11110 [Bacillus paranthracis]|nr:hypothetical protein [Bacillus paranthracis]
MTRILEEIILEKSLSNGLTTKNAHMYMKVIQAANEIAQIQRELYISLTDSEKSEIKEVMLKTQSNNYPEYLTTQDVAKLLKISTQMVRRYCADGKIDATQRMEGTGAWLIKTEQFLDHPDLLKVLSARENAREKNRNKSIGFANSMLKLLND